MISSTARDMPAYREQVKEACLRAEMLPKMMEHLPASDADAIEVSLKMVDKADVYVGLFAYRYGHIPEDNDISITQMEYERALEVGIPICIFIMDESVPVLPKDFDMGEPAVKLHQLKEKLTKSHVCNFYKNPDNLHTQVLHSLNEVRKQFEEARSSAGPSAEGDTQVDILQKVTTVKDHARVIGVQHVQKQYIADTIHINAGADDAKGKADGSRGDT